jgi:tRNA pseudouridine55 synthase
MIEGVFAIYKEEGMTSHDVVDAVRRLTGHRRVGHAGTLDPCAKGVLVIGVGRAATRQLRSIAGTEKEYITRVKLGWRSTTEDREGKIEQVFWTTEDRRQKTEDGGRKAASSGQIPSEERVREALTHFLGAMDQRPPVFSAIKVRGRAAYKLARKGLGTGAYMEQLERIRVGTYTKERAAGLSNFAKSIQGATHGNSTA